MTDEPVEDRLKRMFGMEKHEPVTVETLYCYCQDCLSKYKV